MNLDIEMPKEHERFGIIAANMYQSDWFIRELCTKHDIDLRNRFHYLNQHNGARGMKLDKVILLNNYWENSNYAWIIDTCRIEEYKIELIKHQM